MVAADRSIARKALLNRTPVSVPCVLRDGLFTYRGGAGGLLESETDRAVLVIPMKRGRTLLGIVVTADRRGRIFIDAEIGLAEALVDRAVVTLARTRFSAAACERTTRSLVACLRTESAAIYRLHRRAGNLVLAAMSLSPTGNRSSGTEHAAP